MPRPSNVDFDSVLEKATRLFWSRGFTDVSVEELVNATGVNRYALYAEFGDKEAVFQAALDWYGKNIVSMLLADLEGEKADLNAIEAFFHGMANAASGPGGFTGCLMCNTSIELGPQSFAGPKVTLHFDRMREAFARGLRRALSLGQIPEDLDPEQGADFLNGLAHGLFVLARQPDNGPAIKNMVAVGLTTFTKPYN